MATKTPKTKKIANVKKHKNFDLSFDRKEQKYEVVDALQSLQADRGWQLLKQIFEGNIAVLEAAILRKISPDDGKTALSEEDCDKLRFKLSYLEELLNKPQEIIGELTRGQPEMPEYDPYHKVEVRSVGRKKAP